MNLNLGPLHSRIDAAAKELGVHASELVRRIIAAHFGVAPPKISRGNPEIAKHAAKGGRAKGKR
jgi:hypothetical protein